MNLSFDFEPQAAMPPGNRLVLPVVNVYNLDAGFAPKTPRGPAYRVYDYLNGIIEYDTHRKSCASISPALAKRIPKALRQRWYFECDNIFVPLYYLYPEYRLIAEHVAAVEGESQLPRYGSLSFIFKSTREQVLQYMLQCPLAAAVFDFENGISRNPGEHWALEDSSKEQTIALYLHKLEDLKQPEVSSERLMTGVRVRFDQAVYFEYQGQQVAVNYFTVKRVGRKVLFLAQGYPFAARAIDLKERSYSIVP
jgi:hypothetical protein